MATNNGERVVYGAHLWVDGGATPVTGDNPPAGVAAEDWVNLGACETLNIEPQDQEHEWMVPCPGVKYRTGLTKWQVALNWRATVIYGGNPLWDLLLKSDFGLKETGAVAAFAPLATPNMQRWCQFQYYDEAGTLRVIAQLFSHVCIETGPDLGNGGVQYEVYGRQLHSPYQVGQLFAAA